MHVAIEYSDITPRITIGTNMCCVAHGRRLIDLGFEADIDLEAERQEIPPRVEVYIWLPIPNHTAPTQDQLDFGAMAIQTFVALNKKIYVHCHNGHGRAPTMVAGYFILLGQTADEAVATVKTQRPEIHLEESQQEALERFYRRHRGAI